MRLRWTRNEIRSTTVGMSFLLPNILGFLIFTAVPLVISLFMAFTDWNLEMHNMFRTGSVKLVGFGNFTKLFTDPDFSFFLGNTLFLMLGIPFGIAGSLGAALLLNHNFKTGLRRLYWIIILTVIMTASCLMLLCVGMAASALTVIVCGVAGAAIIGGAFGGQSVYRTLFYLPSFTSGVATFILWKKLYSPENGPINNVLQPLLDCITPIASKLSPGAAAFLAGALLILMGSSALLTIRRRIRLWSLGECGSPGLVIGMTLLVTPLLCCRFWSALSWGGWFGAGIATLGILLAAVRLRRGRSFGCVYDYGLTDAVIIDGMFMLGLFCLLGLTNVVMAMPVDANAPGGYLAPKWLADYYWAKPALMLMGFWGAIGSNNMLLYLAGLSGISQDLYEAADIDGATPFQRFWHVTWPQLSSVTFFILVMSIMGGLQGGFETARVMTNGGPAGSTTTLAYYIYNEGFATGRLGYASAVSWTLFAMVFGVTIFNWKFGNKYTND